MSNLTITFEGREIDPLSDFTLAEWEWLEDELGPLADVDLQSVKARVRIYFLLKRRVDPDLTLEQVWAMGLADLTAAEDADDRPAAVEKTAPAKKTTPKRPTQPRAKS